MKDSRTSSIVLHNLLIAVLAFIWQVPIIWLVCTSFSAYSGMNTSTFFPKEWSITNYLKLFHPDSVSQFPQWFLNTFIIACFTCVISTMFVLMVAYATSVMRFKMRKPLMNMAVILNLFPGMLAMIAVYFTLKSFNLTNSYAGLIMVYSASFMFSWGSISGDDQLNYGGGKNFLPDGSADEPPDRCLYSYQQFPGTMDGFRVCKDDSECRNFFQIYSCHWSV